MFMDKRISVIVPVYNVEAYLNRCVDSILAQSYEQLEIILVDDGSTDRSPAICDAYVRQDERIRVIHKENGGLSDARNAGLQIATGEYIGFVDSDDWIEPDMYRDMYEAAVKYDAQVAVCRYAEVYKDRVVDGSQGDVLLLNRKEVLDIYICEHPQYKIYNSVWSKLFCREVIADLKFPMGRNSEDIVFTTKAFCRLERCVYLDRAYYNYVRERDGSIMNGSSGERMLKDEIPFWREHIECIQETGETELADKAKYYFYKRLVGYYLLMDAEKTMQPYANAILHELQKDRKTIKRVYENSFVKRSDQYRMRLILTVPRLYSFVEGIYQRWVIPFRNKE